MSHQRLIWEFHCTQVTKHTGEGIHPGFEKQGKHHQKPKTRLLEASQKTLMSSKKSLLFSLKNYFAFAFPACERRLYPNASAATIETVKLMGRFAGLSSGGLRHAPGVGNPGITRKHLILHRIDSQCRNRQYLWALGYSVSRCMSRALGLLSLGSSGIRLDRVCCEPWGIWLAGVCSQPWGHSDRGLGYSVSRSMSWALGLFSLGTSGIWLAGVCSQPWGHSDRRPRIFG